MGVPSTYTTQRSVTATGIDLVTRDRNSPAELRSLLVVTYQSLSFALTCCNEDLCECLALLRLRPALVISTGSNVDLRILFISILSFVVNVRDNFPDCPVGIKNLE